jgi:hypothetical protein
VKRRNPGVLDKCRVIAPRSKHFEARVSWPHVEHSSLRLSRNFHRYLFGNVVHYPRKTGTARCGKLTDEKPRVRIITNVPSATPYGAHLCPVTAVSVLTRWRSSERENQNRENKKTPVEDPEETRPQHLPTYDTQPWSSGDCESFFQRTPLIRSRLLPQRPTSTV